MSADRLTAMNEICDLFKAAWEADPTSQNIVVLYPEVPDEPPQGNDASGVPTPWAQVNVLFTSSEPGAIGNRKFNRAGIVVVDMYTAFGIGATLRLSLLKIAEDAFEGKATPSGVWFRETSVVTSREEGDSWTKTSLSVNFIYDEVK